MTDKDKKTKDVAQEIKEEKTNIDKQERREWVREGIDETGREKKKAFGFAKKLTKALDLRKKAMFGGKFTHGTRGKSTHGPRGNQG